MKNKNETKTTTYVCTYIKTTKTKPNYKPVFTHNYSILYCTVSQKEQFIGQLFVRRLVQRLADQKRQFVRVLARSRHSNGALPIVIQMAHLVSQTLHMVRFQTAVVVNDVVRNRRYGTLSNALRNQVKIVPDKIIFD